MSKHNGGTERLSPWVLHIARAAKEQALARAVWKLIGWLPPVRKLALRVRSREAEVERERIYADRMRDPEAIAAVSISRNEAFASAKSAADAIDGMFSDFSMAVADSFLSFQAENHVTGDMLELGVYKGRSAALFGPHLKDTERLVLVDIADQLDRKAIAPFQNAVDFIVSPAGEFANRFPQCAGKRSYRFIHIDASHAYRATFAELRIADGLLADMGIIALDDFININYAQNAAAIYKYLYTASTNLEIFLVTEKAYLCRRSAFVFYAGFVLERLIAEMRSRDISDCVLARTDSDPEYSAFAARHRLPGEEGHFYGFEIYKNYFRRP